MRAGAAALIVGGTLAALQAFGIPALSALVVSGFLALIVFRLSAALTPAPPAPPPGPSRNAPPIYTVIAPMHREPEVAADLVAALGALDYPSDRLDIKLVLEADDLDTLAALSVLRLGPSFEVLIAPPGVPRTKPRALNFALAYARGDYVVIYDAEDRPSKDQIRTALDAFDAGDDRLACVQAPLSWYNAGETWLTRQFALEYAALFHVVLPALARWGWPLPLGGTSNHFRRAALEAAGGWDPYNVTEDADLGFRLAELGWRSTVIAPGTAEEAVTTLAPWTRQRSRWIKGFLQTLLVRLSNLPALARNAGWKGLAALLLTIALPVASSMLHGPLALWALWELGAGAMSPADVALLVAGYGVAAATAWLGLRRSGQCGLAASIALMPLYWPLQTLAAARAARDLALRPFHWEKTRHGVTRLGGPSPSRLALTSSRFRSGRRSTRLAGPQPAAQQPQSRRADDQPGQKERHEAHDEPRRLGEHLEELVERAPQGLEGVLTEGRGSGAVGDVERRHVDPATHHLEHRRLGVDVALHARELALDREQVPDVVRLRGEQGLQPLAENALGPETGLRVHDLAGQILGPDRRAGDAAVGVLGVRLQAAAEAGEPLGLSPE